ncbi:hypothetical protein LMJF_11_0640 [Leishmania major strain Friedlin]|uniref:Uncharacterized protein n=1 Tax=Leishmania major TaxID=5664 RepID=Q4QH16_LEIMA|nr:hypothetical protein LMJF_11_0640 [Leishmania major strain Friedlin]CAG9570188.1 hypothetical_protein_-_conserved [Leishmania major strain Friedlin]CAJ02696.1 hypothetical protein LMJF_11_0640 [Leishmania major strain Friedlin]|eukprot:XP_001681532.1 hypothetical protein LMJF_11_0640 [Leishmania major strain Friedlin]
MASSVTETSSAHVNDAASMPTHPRTRLVLQLLALEALRREQRRGVFPLSSPPRSSVSTAASLQEAASGEATPAAAVAAPAACRSLRLGSSCHRDTRFEEGGLPVVYHWLWQRAAALPSGLAVAESPYGDLSALMMEWATLALPAWLESSEEVRWRYERDEVLRLVHESATTAAACGFANLDKGAREAEETAATVPGLVQQADTSATDTVAANSVRSLSRYQAAFVPEVKDVNDEDVSEPSLAAVSGPLSTSAAHGAPSSSPRRVLQLVVAAAANLATPQQADLTIAKTTAVAPLPSPAAESEGALVKATGREPTSVSGTVPAFLMTPPLQSQVGDTPAMSSANAAGSGDGDVGVEKRLAIQLLRTTCGTAVPREAATAATAVVAEPSCNTAVDDVVARVATRPPMLLSDEGVTDDDGEARGSMAEANDSAQDGSAFVSPAPEGAENTAVCMRSRLRRWRRIAPVVLDAPPGSEAAQDVCTVLEALGFAKAGEDDCADKTLTELAPSCGSAQAPGELLKGPKVPASRRFSEGAARARMPLCPLGRLPPLLTAHAWLSSPSLRSSWLAHIIAVWSPECLLAVGDDGSEACLKDGGTALGSSRDAQATPLPVPASSPSSSAHCSGATPPSPQLPSASPALSCIALADHRVFAMLDELLWCAHPSASTFLLSFEANLHAYLCYPLAGVCAAAPAAATATKSGFCQSVSHLEQGARIAGSHGASAPRPLTVSAWKAYLELRYGKAHLRQPKHLHPSPLRTVPSTKAAASRSGTGQNAEPGVTASAAAAPLTVGGPHRTKKREAGGRTAEGEAALRPAMSSVAASAAAAARTPLLPFVAAAFAASSSATASTATYAAVMDVGAMVFLAELRRVGAIAMVEKARGAVQVLQACHVGRGAGPLRHSTQQRGGESGDSAESGMCVESTADAEGVRQFSSAAADASCFKAVQGGCDIPISSLQALLEGTVECDTSLHRYVCRWFVPLSPPSAVTMANHVQESPRDIQDEKPSLVTVAAHLWLALVTVLSLGESATAQYVRGVLMPPASLPVTPCSPSSTWAAALGAVAEGEAVGVPSWVVRTSLAPFTMPTLFRSTLEDLYQEESAATAAAVAVAGKDHNPPCRPSSLPLCAPGFLRDEEDPASRATASCRVAPASLATTTLQGCAPVTPATQDTLVLSAAVALRHPRVILRQLHFLWQLSNCENRDGYATKADDSSHHSATLSSPSPAPPDTGRTAASTRRPAGAADHRATAKGTSDPTALSFKQEFATRVASLVECVQMASLAGLPPPLAASLTPSRPSPSAVPAEAAGGALSGGASASSMRQWSTGPSTSAVNVSTAVALSQQQCGAAAVPPHVPPLNADSARAVTAHATSTRLRLQLSSKTSLSSAVTAGVGAFKTPTTDGVKRSREMDEVDVGVTEPAVLSSSENVAARSSRPAKRHRMDSVATHALQLKLDSWARAPPPPPPLESLAELHVRWADEVHEKGGSVRLSLTPLAATSSGAASDVEATTSRSALLLTVVADTLWNVLQHIHAQVLGVAVGSAHVPRGDDPTPNDPSAATSASPSVLLRDAEATPGGVPVRRTLLRLRVSPAYRALQRLWQAINPPTVSERSVVVSSEAGTLPPSGGAAAGHPRLDVILPATASRPATAVDLRVYTSLTASLRGVVCVVLGYAVHECLQAIWCNWCALCNEHEDSATTAGCATASSGSAQQPSRTPFPPSHGAYAWLTRQLRALLDEVLQPLNRILKASLSGVHDIEPVGDRSAPDVVRCDGHALAEPLSSSLRQPGATHVETLATAAWLTYKPLGLVLLPAHIRQLDAAMPCCLRGDCAAMSGGLHRLDAYEAWAQVKVALQQAGVQA